MSKLDELLSKINNNKTVTVQMSKNNTTAYFIYNAFHTQQEQIKNSFVIANFIEKFQNKPVEKNTEKEFIDAYTNLLDIVNNNLLTIKVNERFLGLSDDEETMQLNKSDVGYDSIKEYIFQDIEFTISMLSQYLIELNKNKNAREKLEKK